jgi:hypothetical protein
LLKEAGIEALVAQDCPAGLMGAFHQGKQALLMCGNNLQDDPAQVWVVLAHESAHVMQDCKGEYLMPPGLLAKRWIKRGARTLRLFWSFSSTTPASTMLRRRPVWCRCFPPIKWKRCL